MTMNLVNHRAAQSACAVRPRFERGRKALRGLGLLCGLLVMGACEAKEPSPLNSTTAAAPAAVKSEELRMWMTVGGRRFAITLADNAAARALAAQLPLTLNMAELNGNEKHGELPKPLPTDAIQPGTIRAGDLMLYGSSTLVVFYLTFDSSYSYTRLGQVDDPVGLTQALGRQNARIEFSKD